METKLLPCPFCGGEARMLKQTTFNVLLYGTKCNKCGAEAAVELTEAMAVESWNRRAYRPCCPEPCNEQCWNRRANDAN